jgi:acetylornithine deacetylase/succinyl-diaminopimelate desuccinylase-like protein
MESVMDERITSSLDYFTKHEKQFIDELAELIHYQSISTPPKNVDGLAGAVDWIAERLRRIPLDNVKIHSTSGQPILFGGSKSKHKSSPTILLFGHYDVVSIGDPNSWKTDPFKAEQVGDYIYGRGSSDMKGPIISVCAALQSIRSNGGFPCNIKIFLEGEEEFYSPSLQSFLESNRTKLACDYCLSPDAGMLGKEKPTVVYSLRGAAMFKVTVFGPSQDLHSGMFGGVVQNPVHVLCGLLTGLHNEHGQIQLPDFYNNVLPLTEEERAVLARHPYDERAFLDQTGVQELWGETGFSPIERVGRRPALEVVLFDAGSMKHSIPSKAVAVINIRLVPNQTPGSIHDQLKVYFRKKMPPALKWDLEFLGGCAPTSIDSSSKFVKLFGKSLEEVWGEEVVYHPHGGSMPAVSMIQSTIGIGTILSGPTLPDDHLHSPNERMHIPTWRRFTEALIRFIYSLDESI